ncbi:WRKY DNA-binding transcription factor 70-like [Rosa chinensis]|uniref:WRKY DNA-binding transcription factor 70-like n=1 Tax=Rosa chinensis TaxID=74649 RepID=UPI000D086A4B|nr:WRKY DNA-binding transcription factor 70-like [Rosa chinensis]
MEEQILTISETKSHNDSCDILSVSRKGKEGVGVRLEESPAEGSSAGESKKRPGSEDQKGSNKRRKSPESWTVVSNTLDDGQVWRKYGQKEILGSPYPRAYFRCTRKYDQGCQATKRVQQVQDTPKEYEITYKGNHTCVNMMMIMGASDPATWPTPVCSKKEHGDLSSSLSLIPFVPEKKEECKEGTTASGLVDNVNDTSDMWTDFESPEFVFPDLGTEQSP